MKKVIKYLYITFCFLLLFLAASCKSTSASKKNIKDTDKNHNPVSEDLESNSANEKLESENTTDEITEERLPTEEDPALVEGMPSATQEEVPIVPLDSAPESIDETVPPVEDSVLKSVDENVPVESIPDNIDDTVPIIDDTSIVEPNRTTEEALDSNQPTTDEPISENIDTDNVIDDSVVTKPVAKGNNGGSSSLKIDAIQEDPQVSTVKNIDKSSNKVASDTTNLTVTNNQESNSSPIDPVLPMASAPVTLIPNNDEDKTNSSLSSEPSFENAVETVELEPIEINVITGEDARIELEGEDWFPSSSDINPSLTYKGKDYTIIDKSVFIFTTSINGQFDLVFNRNTANSLESQKVKIIVGDRVDPISTNNDEKVGDVVTPLPSLESVDVATLDNNTLKRYFDQELNNNNLDSAKNLLQVLRTKDNRAKQIAEMLYLLGQKHETDVNYKDIDDAFSYYKDAYDNYPISKFSRMSKERMDYLNRFYLKVP